MRPYSSLEEALAGLEIPSDIRETLVLIDIKHLSFDGSIRNGQLVLHQDLAQETKAIFDFLTECRFPIQKVIPIVAYGWDDEASMQDNNTSAFNYRQIVATNTLSSHSFGRAIDINPLQNPYFARDGKVYPEGSVYDPAVIGTITKDAEAVRLFKGYGWEWLGEREQNPDYQHFQKL